MQKSTLYFLSGTMCDDRLWFDVFDELENYHCQYIDITVARSFEEINEILLQQIPKNSTLIGFSLGGYAATYFASTYPNYIKKIIVIATDLRGLDASELKLRKGAISFLEHHVYKGIANQRLLQFLHPIHHENEAIKQLIKTMDSDLGKAVLIRQLKTTSTRINLLGKLTSLPKQTLFIGSKEDKIVENSAFNALNGQLSTPNIQWISKSGHMIPLEQPIALANTIRQFINNSL